MLYLVHNLSTFSYALHPFRPVLAGSLSAVDDGKKKTAQNAGQVVARKRVYLPSVAGHPYRKQQRW